MTPSEAKPTPTRALKVRRVKLDKLVLDEGNPRLHDERDLAATTASLKAHGQVDPLVVQAGTMRVVAGHGRIESMRRLGWTDAQIVEVECDDAEFRALSIRLNRTGELAGWNAVVLDAALSELAEAGWGNLPKFGFDGAELDALVKGMDEPAPRRRVSFLAGEGGERAGNVSDAGETSRDRPDSVPGMIYELGPHRLMCGDCRNPSDVRALLGGAKIQVAVTSPPYAAQREYDEASGFQPIQPDDFVTWFDPVQANVREHIAPDGSWFVNIKEHVDDGERSLYVKDLTIAHVREWGWKLIDEFCWERVGLPGQFRGRFKNGWEPVFHFALVPGGELKFRPDDVCRESDAVPVYSHETHLNTVGGLTGIPADRDEAQRRAKERKSTAGLALPNNRLPPYQTESTEHSAAYPVKLPLFFILAFSDAGDAVYDPFCGSGSSLLAAAVSGRVGYGMEISPKFCDLIRRRWTVYARENGQEPGSGALDALPAGPESPAA